MEQNPKQQVIERLKSATNILVTVSNNPTVDQLAACIGFTLMLNKLGKHGTAVFSGAVPSTLEFLQPEKTLEKNTDSLQDFIIALDKSKADKLRYKVEDDVVRIFITPYRTSISEKDLDFSLGDFNVDVIVALGVNRKEEIDQAIVTHGRILHDATVMTVTVGEQTSDVGSINWHEPAASSLSEMLVSISESFQSGLLDPQMATSFLTGIVAETDRFSNEKTSPKVMTMSAQLMAAGANQQLIATKLTPPVPEPVPEPAPSLAPEPAAEEPATEEAPPKQPHETPKPDGEIAISHDHAPIGVGLPVNHNPEDEDEIHIDDDGNLKRQAELQAAQKAEAEAAAKAAEEAEAAEVAADQPSGLAAAQPGADADTDAVQVDNRYLASDSHKVLAPLPGQDAYDPLEPDGPTEPVEPAEPAINLPPVQAEPPAFPEVPPAPAFELQPPATHPDSPPVQNYESLTKLEEDVHSTHLAENSAPAQLDQARQAVENANLDTTPAPQAAQSLGAQHVDLEPAYSGVSPAVQPTPPEAVPPSGAPMTGVADILQSTGSGDSSLAPPPVSDPLAPPPVPPPMTAPYFEPKPSHHNPYLNPDGKPAPDKPA